METPNCIQADSKTPAGSRGSKRFEHCSGATDLFLSRPDLGLVHGLMCFLNGFQIVLPKWRTKTILKIGNYPVCCDVVFPYLFPIRTPFILGVPIWFDDFPISSHCNSTSMAGRCCAALVAVSPRQRTGQACGFGQAVSNKIAIPQKTGCRKMIKSIKILG